MNADDIMRVQFLALTRQMAERTVICSPENESRIKTMIDVLGLGNIVIVHVSPYMPDDRLYIVDENALQAARNETIQRTTRSYLRKGLGL